MAWWVAIRFWLRARLRERAVQREIDEELHAHIRMRTEELVRDGWEPREARRYAIDQFGRLERTRDACRELYMVKGSTKGDGMMWELWRDVRFALRGIGRQPAFAAAVILTLGLGIGANSAIFSVLNGVLFQPLPYDDPGELVRVWQADRVNGTRFEGFSRPDFFDVLERNTVFAGAAVVENRTLTITGTEDDPQRLRVVASTHDLMSLLGVPLALGRSFLPEEDLPGGELVAILGHGLWMSRFGADESVVGRSVRLDGLSYRVVGVADPGLEFPSAGVQLWIPVQMTRETRQRGNHNFGMIARLAPDVTVERAAANLAAIAAALEEEYAGENAGRDMWPQPLHESVVGRVQTALYLMGGAVGLVLLIACVNVANLLFARGKARELEVAIRLAMGAGRRRLMRQFLTEYVVLGGLGGLVGLGIAAVGVRGLLALSPASLPRQGSVGIDGEVLAFTMLVSLVTGLVCGLLPALQGARADLRASLTDGGRGTTSGLGSQRLRNGLVVLEVAMAVVLVSSAGLLIKSFSRMEGVDPGFDPRGVLSVDLQLPASRYPMARANWPNYVEVLAFQRELVARARSLPNVTSAALAMNGPTLPGWTTRFGIEGRAPEEIGATEEVRIRIISSGYAGTIGLEPVSGRLLDERDDLAESPPVMLINEAMVERYFPSEEPLGQRINNWGIDREIVGVVRDVRFMGLVRPVQPAVYPTFARMPFGAFSLLVRTTGDPMGLVQPLRAQVLEMDPDLALGSIASLESMLSATTGQSRFNALLLAIFAGMSLLLAAVGIYGVISYGVSQRTHEIGVRISLGASGGEVARKIVAQGLRLTALGIVIGIVGTLASARLLGSLMFGVETLDPGNLLAVVGLSVGVAILASYLPARRASRVDPMAAVRGD